MRLMEVQIKIPFLQTWYPRLGLGEQELRTYLEGPTLQTCSHRNYGKLHGLHIFANDPIDTTDYFLLDGQVVLIYLENDRVQNELKPSQITDLLGEPTRASTLRSRADRDARLYVYAEHGIAFSAQEGRIDYIELFQPMTFAAYLKNIYWEPGPWYD